LESGDGRD